MSSASQSVTDTLRIYGNLSLLEMAPVLLAAEQIYPGETVVEHGSVMALWGKSSDLASLDSAGQSDIAMNSETQALRASSDHPDLRFIFTVAECPYRIVARRSAGIARLADLRGKRIGTQLESSGEYFLDAMLRTVGLTAEDVTRVPFMAHTDSPISLLPEWLHSGRIDAVALWEPQVQRAKVAIGGDAIEFCDPAVYTEKFNLCTRQANLDDPAMRKLARGPRPEKLVGRKTVEREQRDTRRIVRSPRGEAHLGTRALDESVHGTMLVRGRAGIPRRAQNGQSYAIGGLT